MKFKVEPRQTADETKEKVGMEVDNGKLTHLQKKTMDF